jgi:2-haloacid dehalogenase
MTPKKNHQYILLQDKQVQFWFGMLLHYSTVSNSINEYHNFTYQAA